MNTTSFSDTVKTLSDRGYANAEIAQSTGASRHKVGAVLAHHWHPASWNKGNKAKDCGKDFVQTFGRGPRLQPKFRKSQKTSGKSNRIIGFAIIFG
jgi:hypothetical protein